MRMLYGLGVLAIGCAAVAQPAVTPDYSKRAAPIDPSLATRIGGRWTNPVDHVVLEITSIDPVNGRIGGEELAPGSASDQIHELVGWVSDAPVKDGFDHVVPITLTTTLYEYGTLPVWAGFVRGTEIVTVHTLVWPNRTYPWDHVTVGQETWTKLPAPGEWRKWTADRKLDHMQAIVLADERTLFAAYDRERFSAMTCKTCHGAGAVDRTFKMPNPSLPALDATPEGFQRLAKEKPAALAFMGKVVRRTADLLGEPPFSMQTNTGFGCFACHVAKP